VFFYQGEKKKFAAPAPVSPWRSKFKKKQATSETGCGVLHLINVRSFLDLKLLSRRLSHHLYIKKTCKAFLHINLTFKGRTQGGVFCYFLTIVDYLGVFMELLPDKEETIKAGVLFMHQEGSSNTWKEQWFSINRKLLCWFESKVNFFVGVVWISVQALLLIC
jgi:hypothetical protein